MTCVHHDLLDGRGLTASALLLALIHELRGNRFSANFALRGCSEVRILALCVAPSLCGRNSYVEITGSGPCLHKTLSGAGRWNRANFAIMAFSEVVRYSGVFGKQGFVFSFTLF
jgi:hypothetical protein